MFEATWKGQKFANADRLPKLDGTEKSPRFSESAPALLGASGNLSAGSSGVGAAARQEERRH